MRRASIKMSSGECVTVEIKEGATNEDVFAEFLSGAKEFVTIGAIAVSKSQVVYVSIQELVEVPTAAQSVEPVPEQPVEVEAPAEPVDGQA
jgi:hypothetical protein